MQSFDPLFARLSRSRFRSRFRLDVKGRQYCLEKGAPVIEQHAAGSVTKHLVPALPADDGKQTLMRGHPVSIAQHTTATCYRGRLAKWHNIPQGEALSEEQQRYIMTVIYHWLIMQMNQPGGLRKPMKWHSLGIFSCRRCQRACYPLGEFTYCVKVIATRSCVDK